MRGVLSALARIGLTQPGWAQHETAWRAKFLAKLAQENMRPPRPATVRAMAEGGGFFTRSGDRVSPAEYSFNDAELASYIALRQARLDAMSPQERDLLVDFRPRYSPAYSLDGGVKPDAYVHDWPKPSIWRDDP